jgi:hypothetical protein
MRPNDYVGIVNGRFVDSPTPESLSGTLLSADLFNALTLEILNTLKAAGIAPNKAQEDQLAAAVKALADERIKPTAADLATFKTTTGTNFSNVNTAINNLKSQQTYSYDDSDGDQISMLFPGQQSVQMVVRTRTLKWGARQDDQVIQEVVLKSSDELRLKPILSTGTSMTIAGLVPSGSVSLSLFVRLDYQTNGQGQKAATTLTISGTANQAGTFQFDLKPLLDGIYGQYATSATPAQTNWSIKPTALYSFGIFIEE